MTWFGADNRISPYFDYELFSYVFGWSLVYFLFLWFIFTSKGRKFSTFIVGTACFLQGCLTQMSLVDNCWLYGESRLNVHMDRYHAETVPAYTQVHFGLQTVNISCVCVSSNPSFHYNEEFQLLDKTADEELKAALAKAFCYTSSNYWLQGELSSQYDLHMVVFLHTVHHLYSTSRP